MFYVALEDGWEGHEVFPDAAAYETHGDNTMACPFVNEMFESSAFWKEVDAWIAGPEAEIAKSSKIMEYHPRTKRIFKDNDLEHEPHWFGYKNERDGADKEKKGAHMVFEMEYEYTDAENAKEEADRILKSLE